MTGPDDPLKQLSPPQQGHLVGRVRGGITGNLAETRDWLGSVFSRVRGEEAMLGDFRQAAEAGIRELQPSLGRRLGTLLRGDSENMERLQRLIRGHEPTVAPEFKSEIIKKIEKGATLTYEETAFVLRAVLNAPEWVTDTTDAASKLKVKKFLEFVEKCGLLEPFLAKEESFKKLIGLVMTDIKIGKVKLEGLLPDEVLSRLMQSRGLNFVDGLRGLLSELKVAPKEASAFIEEFFKQKPTSADEFRRLVEKHFPLDKQLNSKVVELLDGFFGKVERLDASQITARFEELLEKLEGEKIPEPQRRQLRVIFEDFFKDVPETRDDFKAFRQDLKTRLPGEFKKILLYYVWTEGNRVFAAPNAFSPIIQTISSYFEARPTSALCAYLTDSEAIEQYLGEATKKTEKAASAVKEATKAELKEVGEEYKKAGRKIKSVGPKIMDFEVKGHKPVRATLDGFVWLYKKSLWSSEKKQLGLIPKFFAEVAKTPVRPKRLGVIAGLAVVAYLASRGLSYEMYVTKRDRELEMLKQDSKVKAFTRLAFNCQFLEENYPEVAISFYREIASRGRLREDQREMVGLVRDLLADKDQLSRRTEEVRASLSRVEEPEPSARQEEVRSAVPSKTQPFDVGGALKRLESPTVAQPTDVKAKPAEITYEQKLSEVQTVIGIQKIGFKADATAKRKSDAVLEIYAFISGSGDHPLSGFVSRYSDVLEKVPEEKAASAEFQQQKEIVDVVLGTIGFITVNKSSGSIEAQYGIIYSQLTKEFGSIGKDFSLVNADSEKRKKVMDYLREQTLVQRK